MYTCKVLQFIVFCLCIAHSFHLSLVLKVLSTCAGKSVPDLEVSPRLDYHYVHLPGQFMIQKYFESSLIPLVNSIQIQWYHNGTAVDGSRTNSSWKTQGERLTLTLTVFNARKEMDLGLYEGVVTVNCGGGQPGFYICSNIRLYQLQLVSFSVVILQYGKLELLILVGGQ